MFQRKAAAGRIGKLECDSDENDIGDPEEDPRFTVMSAKHPNPEYRKRTAENTFRMLCLTAIRG